MKNKEPHLKAKRKSRSAVVGSRAVRPQLGCYGFSVRLPDGSGLTVILSSAHPLTKSSTNQLCQHFSSLRKDLEPIIKSIKNSISRAAPKSTLEQVQIHIQ